MYSTSSPFFRDVVDAADGGQSQHWGNAFQNHHHLGDAVLDVSRSPLLSPRLSSNLVSTPLQIGGFSQHQQFMGLMDAAVSIGTGVGGHIDNWGDSGIAATSPCADTSTEMDADDRNQMCRDGHGGFVVSAGSYDRSRLNSGDQKTLRRLTQNREAARRSRMRKKAYVQQLENSRLKLVQLEQELQRVRQQGLFIPGGHMTEYSHAMGGVGTVVFDLEYARWLDEHQQHMNELRSAVNAHGNDDELGVLVDTAISHYDELFRLKNLAAKADVFHILSGMWMTPTERCFMWLGGFRSSELLKILSNHVEPLTDQQLMGICNLQQSSQQAEDALSQGMEALQQSLTETLASGSVYHTPGMDNVACYMNLMATAMTKLSTLENFLRQADLLRQQTLQQMHRILTTRQAARAHIAINEYFSRLRALSSLWLARPRD